MFEGLKKLLRSFLNFFRWGNKVIEEPSPPVPFGDPSTFFPGASQVIEIRLIERPPMPKLKKPKKLYQFRRKRGRLRKNWRTFARTWNGGW